MATKVEKVCDLDAAPDAKVFRLTDCDTGDMWEIDLCPVHKDKATLAKVREKGRPVTNGKSAGVGDAAIRALEGKMRNRPATGRT